MLATVTRERLAMASSTNIEPLIVDFSKSSAKNASVRTATESIRGPLADAPLTEAPLGQAPSVQAPSFAALVLAANDFITPLAAMDDEGKPLAFDDCENTLRCLQTHQGKTALCYAVEAAREAGASKVCVLGPADEQLFEQVRSEALAAGATSAIRTDPALQASTATSYRGHELVGVNAYQLNIGAKLVVDSDAQALLVLASDNVRITAGHARALVQRMIDSRTNTARTTDDSANATENAPVEVVSSWIVWSRRLPMLVSATYLHKLAALPEAMAQYEPGMRPLPSTDLVDVVFGEERIATNEPAPKTVTDFFGKAKLSALQAVSMAKGLRAKPEAERDHAIAEDLKPLNDADSFLVQSALEVLDAADSAPSNDSEIAWANAWAERNKQDFPFFNDRAHKGKLSYLDSAATTQRCVQAVTAMNDFDLHENANVYRGGYDLAMQATFSLNDARKVIEDFIGANRRETIYTANTTASTNLAAQAWGDANITEGDLIVACLPDHHSNILPWLLLAERQKARIAYVPYNAAGQLDQHAFDQLLSQKPKLVCLTMVGNVFGIAAPYEQMTRRAKDAGARVFLDGAQLLPHKRINVYDLHCDFLAFSAHKMYGPMGLGCLWVHPDAYAEMTPLASGGGVISHAAVDSYYLRLEAIAYELGTPPVSQAIGFAAAVSWLESTDMSNVEKHGRILTEYALKGLSHIDGTWVLGDHRSDEGKTGLLSFCVEGMSPSAVAQIMGKLGVCVRSGGHCALPLSARLGIIGSTRISIGAYNTTDDIDAALVGLKVCRHLFA